MPSHWGRPPRTKLVKPANTSGEQRHHGRHRQARRQEHPGPLRGPALPGLRRLRADRRRDRREGHRGRQVQGSSTSAPPSSTTTQGRRLEERAERAGRGAERQPGGLPEVQDRAVLQGVPPRRDRRQLRQDDVPLKVADTVPALKGNADVPEGRQERHVRPVGAGDVRGLRQGRRDGTPTLKMDGKKMDDRADAARARSRRRSTRASDDRARAAGPSRACIRRTPTAKGGRTLASSPARRIPGA